MQQIARNPETNWHQNWHHIFQVCRLPGEVALLG